MAHGKILLNLEDLRNELENENEIILWGPHQTFHKGHDKVYRSLCEIPATSNRPILSIYYQNWATLIKDFTGCGGYTDPPFSYDIATQLLEISDYVYVMAENDFFSGRYGYYKQDLWSMILDQLPDKHISDKIATGPARTNLYSHLRTAQAMKIVFNSIIQQKTITGGCVRDAWRWDFRNWYEKQWPGHEYILIRPELDEHGNTYSGSRKININKTLLKPFCNSVNEVNEWVKEFNITCDYFFKLNGYMYARFSDQSGSHFVEGVPECRL